MNRKQKIILGVISVASYVLYTVVELGAHLVRFPPKPVPQCLLSPYLPLFGLLGNWLDVDSMGIYGILVRAAFFTFLVVLLAFLILKSRGTRRLSARIPMYLVSGWYALTIVGFHLFRIMMDHSGWTD